MPTSAGLRTAPLAVASLMFAPWRLANMNFHRDFRSAHTCANVLGRLSVAEQSAMLRADRRPSRPAANRAGLWHAAQSLASTCQEVIKVMPYQLPPLPYAFNALEPHIDARTMEIHHDKHHEAYVTNLNKAIEGTDLGNQPIEVADRHDRQGAGEHPHGGAQQRRRPCQPLAVLDDHGPGQGGEPSGKLADAIKSNLGGFDAFKEAFTKAGRRPVRQRLGLAERR